MSKVSAFMKDRFGIPEVPFWATVRSIRGGQLVAMFRQMGLAKVRQFVDALDDETFALFRQAVDGRASAGDKP